MANKLRLGIDKVKQYLPHREPFLFVDEITEVVPGKSVIGKRTVRKDEFFFKGHFPNFPVFPGALIVETMAQVSAFIILTMPGNERLFGLFTGIEHFEFRKSVYPGDTLIIKSNFISFRHGIAKSMGKAYVNGKLVAQGIISAFFSTREKILSKGGLTNA